MQKLASILLIDDDDTTNFLNERLLQRLGVAEQVYTVTSGQQALDLLAEPDRQAPSLILLDMAMPGMTGIEFLKQCRQQFPAQPTVVLVLTTIMDYNALTRINELRIDGLISKPLTEKRINELLWLHFQRQLPTTVEEA